MAALRATNQLNALRVSSELGVGNFPDNVLTAWAIEIVRAHRVVNQSESAFIEEARNKGWTWEQIRDRLGFQSLEVAKGRQEALALELERTQPPNIPGAYS